MCNNVRSPTVKQPDWHLTNILTVDTLWTYEVKTRVVLRLIPVLRKYKTHSDSEYLYYLRSDAAYTTIDVRRRKDNTTHRNMPGTRFDLVIRVFEQPRIPLPKINSNKWDMPTFQPVMSHGISYGRAGIIIRLMRRPNRAFISAQPLNHLCVAHGVGLNFLT